MVAKNEKWDVMVSYNWKTGKEYAIYLHKVLTENGYKVWIDEKNMAGELESEIAKAVTNSKIILLLMSEEYEKSHNCIREYTHANSCRKIIIPIKVENYLPPSSSSLALIIAGKMYYELYEKKEENMNKILKEIENHIGRRCSIKVLSEMRGTLKKLYQMTHGKVDQLEHNVIRPIKIDLLKKFVELTVVDVNDAERDTVNIAKQELFLRRQMTYKPIELYKVFSKEFPLLLISGIAGIGKTWLLRKCLLDWASNTLWEKVDFVIYLECRKLNQYQNIVSVNELIKVFYKNIFEEWDVCEHFSIMFVIDGLDEFAYLDELINHNPLNPSKQPIVNALAEILNTQKHKCVVAGRVGAMLQYKSKLTGYREKLTIQIMGFNEKGINEYVERVRNAKEAVKNVLKSSQIAKTMASVPFYLSAMCTIIGSSIISDFHSFCTTTELYCYIFIYFLQKHINRNNDPVYKLMEKESIKQYILKVCKVAWHLFNEGKDVFSQKEIKAIVNDIDEIEIDHLGFIEKVESQLGYQYQFVHLTLMEFCVSIHAHINLSPEEILDNKKLRSCWPMICGLKNENGGPFLRYLANMKTSKERSNSMVVKMYQFFAGLLFSYEEKKSLLHVALALVPKEGMYFSDDGDHQKMFMECFFEAQASLTEDLKRSIDKRKWKIAIYDVKTAHEVSHEKYFMERFLGAGFKLDDLVVWKNTLSENEKKLFVLCSTNVRCVWLEHPVKIDKWTPKHKIEEMWIYISRTFISKNEFEDFLPWIRLAEELNLHLHEDTKFIKDIYEWLLGLNFKWLDITHRGKSFYNIEELKKLK